jgi:hypothetical protein
MGLAEARQAMAAWGSPEDVLGGLTPGLRVRDAQLSFDFFAHFESDSVLTAVEIWRPLGKSPASVTWNGIDIFQTPPDVLLQRLRESGLEVDESDPRNPFCPDVTVGFNRSGGPEFFGPGLPSWLESVLVAKPGYYSVEVDFGDFKLT